MHVPITYKLTILFLIVRRSFLWLGSPSVGGESDGEGHCRTADGRKFLLLFRTALNNSTSAKMITSLLVVNYLDLVHLIKYQLLPHMLDYRKQSSAKSQF